MRYSVKSIIARMDKIDLPSLVAKRILPKVNAHIDHFRESEQALRGVRLERRLTASQELDLLLASRYAARNGRLHPAVDNLATLVTKPTEEVYLRSLVERALPLVLPPDECGSKAVRVMAREIVTVVVLVPLMEMFGDPDFWNRTIDQFVRVEILHNCFSWFTTCNVFRPELQFSSKSSSIKFVISLTRCHHPLLDFPMVRGGGVARLEPSAGPEDRVIISALAQGTVSSSPSSEASRAVILFWTRDASRMMWSRRFEGLGR